MPAVDCRNMSIRLWRGLGGRHWGTGQLRVNGRGVWGAVHGGGGGCMGPARREGLKT